MAAGQDFTGGPAVFQSNFAGYAMLDPPRPQPLSVNLHRYFHFLLTNSICRTIGLTPPARVSNAGSPNAAKWTGFCSQFSPQDCPRAPHMRACAREHSRVASAAVWVCIPGAYAPFCYGHPRLQQPLSSINKPHIQKIRCRTPVVLHNTQRTCMEHSPGGPGI